jgi:transcriptional regulator with XRE-family HTH domain
MPKGVPYRVHVEGRESPAYTLTEIADGTGLSLSLVSLIVCGKRPITNYAQARLAAFFAIPIGETCAIRVETPQPRFRPKGRLIGYKNRPGYYC